MQNEKMGMKYMSFIDWWHLYILGAIDILID